MRIRSDYLNPPRWTVAPGRRSPRPWGSPCAATTSRARAGGPMGAHLLRNYVITLNSALTKTQIPENSIISIEHFIQISSQI